MIDRQFVMGIDIGGTHTDLVAIDGNGSTTTAKVSTTPESLTDGVLNGIESIAAEHGLSPETVLRNTTTIVHGTTVSTNTLLEDEGAKTGLLTTRGFRDVLDRNMESSDQLYELRREPTLAHLPRRLRRTVDERIDTDGIVVSELDDESVRTSITDLLDAGVDAIAVCLLSAYANDAHEKRVQQILSEFEDVRAVSVSTDVYPEIGVYNRSIATVVDASLKPDLREYLRTMDRRLESAGFDGTLLIMQGNGGSSPADLVASNPIRSVNSGPAAGAVSSASSVTDDTANVISLEMGGTSSDVCVIRDGTPIVSNSNSVGDTAIPIPMVDVTTIGAGGGSVAWIDDRDVLRVGPKSAGSDPGPICYDRGGERPTVTDATLVCGYLNPEYFLGGETSLALEDARAGIERHLADPLGMTIDEVAAGIYEITTEHLINQIREVSIESGYDPREFAIVAAGGAGPVHAATVARRFETRALVPRAAGTFSALGLLETDLKHDFTRSILQPLSEGMVGRLRTAFDMMEAEAHERIEIVGGVDSTWRFERSLETRYDGQVHQLTIPVGSDPHVERIAQRHHDRHDQRYRFSDADSEIEVVNAQVTAVAPTDAVTSRRSEPAHGDPMDAIKFTRMVLFPSEGRRIETPIYDGSAVRSGTVSGPGIIELPHTTVVIPPDCSVTADPVDPFVLSSVDSSSTV